MTLTQETEVHIPGRFFEGDLVGQNKISGVQAFASRAKTVKGKVRFSTSAGNANTIKSLLSFCALRVRYKSVVGLENNRILCCVFALYLSVHILLPFDIH